MQITQREIEREIREEDSIEESAVLSVDQTCDQWGHVKTKRPEQCAIVTSAKPVKVALWIIAASLSAGVLVASVLAG